VTLTAVQGVSTAWLNSGFRGLQLASQNIGHRDLDENWVKIPENHGKNSPYTIVTSNCVTFVGDFFPSFVEK
jgi:hypothetical protein